MSDTASLLFSLASVATSSYISVTNTTIYSAGGPTAELHSIRSDGGFGEKIQQLQYVSDAEMSTTDRTRKALVRAIFYVIRRSPQGICLLTQCTVENLNRESAPMDSTLLQMAMLLFRICKWRTNPSESREDANDKLTHRVFLLKADGIQSTCTSKTN